MWHFCGLRNKALSVCFVIKGNSLSYDLGSKFSTYDRDHSNCAKEKKGGWWYKKGFDRCGMSNLNGQYLRRHTKYPFGITWSHFRGMRYSLKSVEMKIMPRK